MIKYKYILFDLDGTISESAGGIRKSLEQAIISLGKPLPNLDDYTKYIGPPLIDTFRNYCRLTEEDSRRGLEFYRDFYNKKGKYINKLYKGIEELLEKLKNSDAKVAVCSSKHQQFADEVVDILGISHFFDAVCGSNFDGSRKDKKDLIPYAVSTLGGDFKNDRKNTVLIGDTYFDARGARICNVDFIGVEYGYGDVQQMKEEGAEMFAKTPADILSFISD